MKNKNKLLLIISLVLLSYAIVSMIIGAINSIGDFFYCAFTFAWYSFSWSIITYPFIFCVVMGIVYLVIFFVRNKNNGKNEENMVPTHSENYVESRFGSIELFDDYFVVSYNFVPFLGARRKRAACIIYYDQLVNAMFRPAGWFRGHIWLWSKSCMRQRADIVIPFRLWLPSSSRKNSKEYEAIYNKIVEKIHANKKQLRESATKNVLY